MENLIFRGTIIIAVNEILPLQCEFYTLRAQPQAHTHTLHSLMCVHDVLHDVHIIPETPFHQYIQFAIK